MPGCSIFCFFEVEYVTQKCTKWQKFYHDSQRSCCVKSIAPSKLFFSVGWTLNICLVIFHVWVQLVSARSTHPCQTSNGWWTLSHKLVVHFLLHSKFEKSCWISKICFEFWEMLFGMDNHI